MPKTKKVQEITHTFSLILAVNFIIPTSNSEIRDLMFNYQFLCLN